MIMVMNPLTSWTFAGLGHSFSRPPIELLPLVSGFPSLVPYGAKGSKARPMAVSYNFIPQGLRVVWCDPWPFATPLGPKVLRVLWCGLQPFVIPVALRG